VLSAAALKRNGNALRFRFRSRIWSYLSISASDLCFNLSAFGKPGRCLHPLRAFCPVLDVEHPPDFLQTTCRARCMHRLSGDQLPIARRKTADESGKSSLVAGASSTLDREATTRRLRNLLKALKKESPDTPLVRY
jgi:hypothetical protein